KFKINKNYIWLYFIVFYALWSIKELWLIQYLNLMNPIFAAMVTAILKITIWIIPVFLLIVTLERKDPISYLGLKSNLKKGLKWAMWITFAMVLYFTISGIAMDLKFSLNLGWDFWLNTFIFVGLTEEIVFRGYILRKLMVGWEFWQANTIASLLFVSIHFPIWIYNGLFELPYIMVAIVQVFIISISFGFIYKKTGSLWSVIIIHSMYDLLVSVFN